MKLFENAYVRETLFRTFYILFAFIFCFSISYWKSNTFLTFAVYPYLKLNSFRRLIALDVGELLSLTLRLSTLISSVLVYPFVYIQLGFFLSNAWFESQVADFNKFNLLSSLLFVICFVTCYEVLIPLISMFFVQLDLERHGGLLLLELEPRIANYMTWLYSILFTVANAIPCIVLFTISLFWKLNKKILLLNLVNKRKRIALLSLFLLIFALPVDFSWLVLFFFSFCLVFELLVFCCCWYD